MVTAMAYEQESAESATAAYPEKLVTCECGSEYNTTYAPLFGREILHHHWCPQCEADRTGKMVKPPMSINPAGEADPHAAWRKMCPDGYRDTVVQKLPCGMATLSRIEEWRPGRGGKQSLLIIGGTRHAKTRMAWLLVRQLMYEGKKVLPISDPRMSVRFSDALGRGQGDAYLDSMTRDGVVYFWDDLGKAAATPRYAEAAYTIIEENMAWGRPMIITSQLDSKGLIERMGHDNGGAIAERLRECCEVIAV